MKLKIIHGVAYLDLHDVNIDNVIFELEIMLNKLVMDKIEEVVIIHGKGKGILKAKVLNYLKKNELIDKVLNDNYITNNWGETKFKLIKI